MLFFYYSFIITMTIALNCFKNSWKKTWKSYDITRRIVKNIFKSWITYKITFIIYLSKLTIKVNNHIMFYKTLNNLYYTSISKTINFMYSVNTKILYYLYDGLFK